jgi:hypothetical protein
MRCTEIIKNMKDRSNDNLFISLIVMLGGFYTYYLGLKARALKRAIKYTATSKAVSVSPGLAEISGVARPLGKKYIAPYSKKECVFYITELYKYTGSGKHRKRHLVKKFSAVKPFYLEDDTGHVLIEPNLTPKSPYSKIVILEDEKVSGVLGAGIISSMIGKKPDRSSRLYHFVNEFKDEFYADLIEYKDTIEVCETHILEGDPLFILGTAQAVSHRGVMEMIIRDNPRGKYFYLGDGTEETALKNISSR